MEKSQGCTHCVFPNIMLSVTLKIFFGLKHKDGWMEACPKHYTDQQLVVITRQDVFNMPRMTEQKKPAPKYK